MKLLLAFLLLPFLGIEGCDKNWIRFMVVNACSYAKRAPHHGTYREISLDLVRQKFDVLFGDEIWKEITTAKDENGEFSAKELPDSLDPINFGMGVDLDHDVQRREIKEIVKKCCRSLCTVEDFKGACY